MLVFCRFIFFTSVLAKKVIGSVIVFTLLANAENKQAISSTFHTSIYQFLLWLKKVPFVTKTYFCAHLADERTL